MGTATKTVQHLTVDDLASRFRLTRHAIYRLVKAGTLRALRIGRRIRFRLVDVEHWEALCQRPAPRRKPSKKRGAR